ncbi:unnamed protein product [Lupinus luteus]|uniref:Uncharacterized protein n=1 Tax=Lupinus luteus TaxID=3873 RepID=A0AAV1XLP1_LUPLU
MAKAGAKRVYVVEASDIAMQARRVYLMLKKKGKSFHFINPKDKNGDYFKKKRVVQGWEKDNTMNPPLFPTIVVHSLNEEVHVNFA